MSTSGSLGFQGKKNQNILATKGSLRNKFHISISGRSRQLFRSEHAGIEKDLPKKLITKIYRNLKDTFIKILKNLIKRILNYQPYCFTSITLTFNLTFLKTLLKQYFSEFYPWAISYSICTYSLSTKKTIIHLYEIIIK